jgi:pimeloyl-ACP methyl ester carboxylesterase/predicted glycosyltransferase
MTGPALAAVQAGHVERDGVRVGWQRHGVGERAVLLMPTWEIVDSRIWKFQIPFLARRFTVLSFDPRGHGRSDRPAAVRAYDRDQRTADAVAVLDAAGIGRASLISWCNPGDDLALAAEHPERVQALVLLAPDLLLTEVPNEDIYDRVAEWSAFAQDFFSLVFSEPHSTKPVEDSVGWAMETDADTILRGMRAAWDNEPGAARQRLNGVRCPVLVIQGSEDRIVGPQRGRAVAAELADATLLKLVGSGHGPHLRDPVRVNLAVREFVGDPGPREQRWTRAHSRRRRALYVSSPIGLGHVRRDLAIAEALRALHPDLEIEWLAQEPVTRVLELHGERIHPASGELASESAHFQAECDGHELNCFEALRRMDEILLANFMIWLDVATEGAYDLWIADEAWDVDYYLHENPELKTAAYAWLTDFVGYLPMPEGGEREAFLTADYNAEMIEQIARYPRVRDRAIFIGDPDDVVPGSFGPGLPAIRAWTEQHFSFSGYVTGSGLPDPGDFATLRDELGFRPDERVCVVTVGGSGVGAPLLRRVIDSLPLARARMPGLRMLVVAGPRIDPATLPAAEGLEIRGYVRDLDRHLAACDLAIVQGGLSTAMELTAARRPFLYFPLGHHFEQNLHVRHRLERYRAGRAMSYEDAGPEQIATAIVEELDRPLDYRRVSRDGAAAAAALIAELL